MDILNYEMAVDRANKVIDWWQNTKLDPSADLSHETNSRLGRVLRWRDRLSNKPEDRTPSNKYHFLLDIYQAELWIRALKYKGNA